MHPVLSRCVAPSLSFCRGLTRSRADSPLNPSCSFAVYPSDFSRLAHSVLYAPRTPLSQTSTANRPLIAAGFKLRDLLHFNAEGNAEFIPLRVPDGISLRGFDIQMVRVPTSSCPCPLAIHLGFFPSLSCLIHHRVQYGRLCYPKRSGDHCRARRSV
jgi:hypothetical protein